LAWAADWLVSPRGEAGSLERFRARAAAVTLAALAAGATVGVPIYLLVGLWLTALLTTGLALVCGVALLRLRAGGEVASAQQWLSMSLSVYLLAAAVCERSGDFSSVAWTVVIPLSGLLLAGVSGGLRGTAWALVCSMAMTATRTLGWVLQVQPEPGVNLASARYLALLLAILGLTFSLELLREQAMREAERSARARGLFLANMSHELRTPLNGVLGLIELVLGTDLVREQREHLELARRSGQGLIALIDDILDLTRVESGGLRLEQVPVDLRVLLDDVLAAHRPNATRRGLSLVAQVDAGVPAVLSLDPTRVRQVLNNLVGNALKFTEHGGVRLEVDARDCLRFVVHDTGIGMAPEALKRLFKPFSQVDDSHTRRFGGTGLGLALSRQLAVAMQGSLELTSSVPGQGSVFTFEVPTVPSTAPAVVLTPSPVRASLSGLRLVPPGTTPPARRPVLVVDDNPVNLRVARGLVERLGYVVDTATNGREALEKVKAGDYLLVLMDCHMPELDGFDATRAVRALVDHRAHLPIIALTASVLPEDVSACQAAGMNECLAKPVTLATLGATLERVLTPAA
jgi:signal transduction histidine kinase/CheY-like chemotaxis protein